MAGVESRSVWIFHPSRSTGTINVHVIYYSSITGWTFDTVRRYAFLTHLPQVYRVWPEEGNSYHSVIQEPIFAHEGSIGFPLVSNVSLRHVYPILSLCGVVFCFFLFSFFVWMHTWLALIPWRARVCIVFITCKRRGTTARNVLAGCAWPCVCPVEYIFVSTLDVALSELNSTYICI